MTSLPPRVRVVVLFGGRSAEHDVSRLSAANILAAEGYFSAKVTVDLQTATEPWILMVHLDPGEPTRVTAVDLRFVGPITEDGDTPNRSTARAAWPLATGQVFRQEDWESAKREVLRHLLARRYPAARIVTSEAEVDPATQSARLAVEYASGPEYRFGAVTVKGLARYAPAIVANLNPIRPGTVYSQAALADLLGSTEGGMGQSVMTRDTPPADTAKFALRPTSKVFTTDDREVRPGSGEVGVVANGGLVPLYYHKDAEKSARTFRTVNGQRYSFPGDMATVEADGSITLLGRGSNCINTGGEKVFPEEVEEILKAHPAVEDALVFGEPDEQFGNRVVAVASLAPGSTALPADIVAQARGQLAHYKLPKQLVLVARVPRAPNGKADYATARQLFGAAKG